MTHTIMEDERAGPPHTIEGSLRKLLKFLEPQNTRRRPVEPVDKPPMLKELEYLYDVLIKPIADRLAKMKVEQKLILAPTKVCHISQPLLTLISIDVSNFLKSAYVRYI